MSVVTNGLPVPPARMTIAPSPGAGSPADGCTVPRPSPAALRTLEPRLDAHVFERVLQRQPVHHGGEHSHVVGGRRLDGVAAGEGYAPRGAVPAADDSCTSCTPRLATRASCPAMETLHFVGVDADFASG